MPITGKALRATNHTTGGDPYMVASLSGVDEVWITGDVYVPQSTFDYIVANDDYSPAPFRPYLSGDPSAMQGYLFNDSGTVTWVFWDTGFLAATPDTSQLHEIHLKVTTGVLDGTADWYVDGTLVASYGLGIDGGLYTSVRFGANTSTSDNVASFLYLDNLKVGTTRGGDDLMPLEDFEGADPLSGYTLNNSSYLQVVDAPTGGDGGLVEGAGGVRVSVAFNDAAFEPEPTWTDITALASSFVASYEIDRGRQFEFDKTDAGSARVFINDRDGLLDPTNTTGAYYGLIEPDLQIKIELWNPVAGEWCIRFRGWIEDFDYTPSPSTHRNQDGDAVGVMRLEISCIDIFTQLTAIEMQPGAFGDPVPTESTGNVFFDNASAQSRILQVLDNAGIDASYFVVFTLNVNVQETVYSPGQNVLEVIQDAVDAEFPTVSNAYTDRHGRLAVHGRLAKFDPVGTAADAGTDAWDFHHWKAGDGAAVAASPSDTAHIREFAWNRGKAQIRNSAFCTPNGIRSDEFDAQLVTDATSIGQHGIKSWSAENLIIGAPTGDPLTASGAGILTGNSALEECQLFAAFVVANYKNPRNRIRQLTVKSMRADDPRAGATWDLLGNVDIADLIDVTIAFPGAPGGTGGFISEPFFVEGIRETCERLNGEYALVTVNLDVMPQAYFSDPTGLDGVGG